MCGEYVWWWNVTFTLLETNNFCVLVTYYCYSSWHLNIESKSCMLQVGNKGVTSLPCDYVLTNILDMSAIESMAVLCTSCKAKEKAVARCSDCANFLCPNCNTAHQVSWLHMSCVLHFRIRNSYRYCVVHCPPSGMHWKHTSDDVHSPV